MDNYIEAQVQALRNIINGECSFVYMTTEDGYDIFNTSDCGYYKLINNQLYLMIKN